MAIEGQGQGSGTRVRFEELIQRYYTLVDVGNIAGLVQLIDVEAVYRRPGYEPLVGRQALERFYREERIIESGSHALATTVIEGCRAAVQGSFVGTLRDGRRVSLRFADFFTLSRRGTFSSRETFFFSPLV